MSRKTLNGRYMNKKTHEYLRKQFEKDNNIDIEKRNSRSVNKNMTTDFAGYYFAMHNEDLPTTYRKKNVTVMMENKQLVTKNVDFVRQK